MKLRNFSWRGVLLAVSVVAVVFIIGNVVYAAGSSSTVTWVHPVTYTDGSALALSDIKETILTWRRPGSTTVAGTVRVTAPANSTVVTGLTCGNFNFTAATVAKNNAQSTDAGPVLYASGVTCAPNPPTGLAAD